MRKDKLCNNKENTDMENKLDEQIIIKTHLDNNKESNAWKSICDFEMWNITTIYYLWLFVLVYKYYYFWYYFLWDLLD